MQTLFLICAVGGGTLMVCQFLLTVVGFGGDADHGGGVGHGDLGHGGLDHADIDHGDVDHGDAVQHQGGAWLFQIITFRTVVAAVTFFGTSGMACLAADLPLGQTLLVSLAAGFLAMLSVFWMMQSMHRFNYDGTMRIDQSVGKQGTVYTSIPASNGGTGKIQISIQDQVVELTAMTTSAQPLRPGTQVVVVSVMSGNAVEVAPLSETAEVSEV